MPQGMPQGMQHLDPERLAALDHDGPSSDELGHLTVCGACRAERAAFAALSALALRSADEHVGADGPRITNWDALSTRLRAEGLLTSPAQAAAQQSAQASLYAFPETPVVPQSRARTGDRVATLGRVMLRVAAGLLLVLGGALGGGLLVGSSAFPFAAGSSTPLTSIANGGASFESVGQATQVLDQAQHDYERASMWLAANDTTVRGSDVYRARLAALDQMMAASRAGLRDAPQDPLLSQYYRAAYAAREATLQQLGSALPVDKTIEGY